MSRSDGLPLPSDDRALRAELRARERIHQQAYETGLAGVEFDPAMWPDHPGIVEAWETGAAERRYQRRPDRRAVAVYRQHRPTARQRRRVARWARRHRVAAGIAAAGVLVALAAVLVVVVCVVAFWWLGRLVGGLASTVRAIGAAWHTDES